MWKTAHTELTSASPDAIWDVIADLDHWPSWNPGIRGAHPEGPVQAGTSGRLTVPNGMSRHFTVLEAKPRASLAVGVSWPGVRQRFQYAIDPIRDDGARVTMVATMDGPLTTIFNRLVGRQIARNYPVALRQLVAAAEKRGAR
jgi:uncharacterized protein YndB with AHSA1/START domain